jgi:meso-butanediol dehydrogenase / (S,S)-butanediol dehydrogenase / diacetyl reductase
MRLANKVALVIGAGGGMGTSVPYLFAREGAQVMLAGRRREPLEALAARIGPHLPPGAGSIRCATGDSTRGEDCERLVAETVAAFGRLNIVYCNVGDAKYGRRSVEELDDEAWRELVDVNLTSNFIPVRAAIPELRKVGGCAILVGAAPIVRGTASPGYAAAKAGLLTLTESLAQRLRPDGIRVNCICPASMGGSQGERDFEEPAAQLDRPPHPADVGYAAVYLASDEAAWVSGQFLDVDGGSRPRDP